MKKITPFILSITLPLLASIPSIDHLSLDEKIGQLFMVPIVSNETTNQFFMFRSPYQMDHDYVKSLITTYHIGGIIFLGHGIIKEQITITRELQQLSTIPLLVGQDLEWGLRMRLHDALCFPHALTLGALPPHKDYLIKKMGYEIGKQCIALGVHINFAPVADVNNNALNPIIHDRSFGQNPQLVAHKASLFSHGMQKAGILSCAKHFPGHGDTHTDSHIGLPVINHDKNHLNSIELFPFKQLIQNNIDAIMTAHLAVPALTESKTIPTSLSSKIISLLRNEYNFNGLIVTDGLGMRGVTKDKQPGQVELEALLAGNDLLVAPVHVAHAIDLIKQAIQENRLTIDELDKHVARILHVKQKIQQPIEYDFHNQTAKALKKELYESAITLVKNNNDTLPLNHKEHGVRITIIGTDKINTPFTNHFNQNNANKENIHIIALYGVNKKALIELQHNETNNVLEQAKQTINNIEGKKIVVLFGSPYALAHIPEVDAIIVAYEEDIDAQHAAADVIFDNINPIGRLPISANEMFTEGLGLSY